MQATLPISVRTRTIREQNDQILTTNTKLHTSYLGLKVFGEEDVAGLEVPVDDRDANGRA